MGPAGVPDNLDAPQELRTVTAANHIAGLIEPAPDFGDPDFAQALRDRELAIQLRAELLVDRAIAEDAPWRCSVTDNSLMQGVSPINRNRCHLSGDTLSRITRIPNGTSQAK